MMLDYLVVGSSIRNLFFSYGFPWTNGPTKKIACEEKNWLGLLDNDVLDGAVSPMYKTLLKSDVLAQK